MSMVQVQIPAGVGPGQQFMAQMPDGQQMAVTVPDGCAPGQMIQVQAPMAMAVAQPAVQMMGGQPGMMVQPGPMATGIDIFGQLQGVWVHQQLHLIEIFNWEKNNKYDLFPCDPKNPGQPSGPQVMHIAEECDCCTRQCCGPARNTQLNLHLGNHKSGPQLATFHKDLHLNLCFFFMRPAMTLEIGGVAGGSVYDPCACCVVNQQVKNANGELAYIITGSVFQCAAMCPCFDMHFDILKPGSEAPVGAVDKIFNGCEELMLNVNKFRILFPEDATNEQKCLLVGAVMLLDFCYFEKEKNNNNNSGAPAGEKTAAAR